MAEVKYGDLSKARNVLSIETLSATSEIPGDPSVEADTASDAAQAAHDEVPPQALLEFMVTGWEARSHAIEPHPEASRFAARRAALSALFPGELLVIPTGHERTRANDTTFRFRPGSDFYYLTGNNEPDCVLVFSPNGRGHDVTMYVEHNPGKTDAAFFTNRGKGELWVGPRAGLAQSQARFGMSTADLARLIDDLTARVYAPGARVRVLRGLDESLERDLGGGATEEDRALGAALSELRLVKDEYEIGELERAIAATKRGFDDVLASLHRARSERYVEGIFNLRARVDGNDVGYGTIAASGSHACTLHWTRNDGELRDGDLLLLDAGVETHSLYTADVTRTIPLGGTFSAEQREIYELVLAAQRAAYVKCAPGEEFLAPNRAAMEVLARGLERLGILTVSADEALAQQHQFYKRYSLHNVSHMLGLDVHDCAQARRETYKYGTLRPGMVLTVEPGLYFQPDDLTVPERFRGIGVRIEDDVLITETGVRILTDAFPSDPDDVEAWVRAAAVA